MTATELAPNRYLSDPGEIQDQFLVVFEALKGQTPIGSEIIEFDKAVMIEKYCGKIAIDESGTESILDDRAEL